MSQQSKIKREKYAKEQEKKGKKVVESISGCSSSEERLSPSGPA